MGLFMSLPLPAEILPHRNSMLVLERVTECSADRIIAHMTLDEEHLAFQGHFPARPIVPGIFLIEAMAQTLAYGYLFENPDKSSVLLVGIKEARFRHPAFPNQRLEIEVWRRGAKLKLLCGVGHVRYDGKTIAEATLSGVVEG